MTTLYNQRCPNCGASHVFQHARATPNETYCDACMCIYVPARILLTSEQITKICMAGLEMEAKP